MPDYWVNNLQYLITANDTKTRLYQQQTSSTSSFLPFSEKWEFRSNFLSVPVTQFRRIFNCILLIICIRIWSPLYPYILIIQENVLCFVREIGRDLTRSYDNFKPLYQQKIKKKLQTQKRHQKLALHNNDQQMRTDLGVQARIQRGDRGSGPPPPPEIDQRWGLVYRLDGQERGSNDCFYLIIIIFFLARFARQYYTNMLHIFILPSSMFSMERLSFLYISLIQIMNKKSNFLSLVFMNGHFNIFCLELHNFTPFKQKFSGGGPQTPPPLTHLQYKNYHANYLFFFACQNFPKVGPPWRKFLDPRLQDGQLMVATATQLVWLNRSQPFHSPQKLCN